MALTEHGRCLFTVRRDSEPGLVDQAYTQEVLWTLSAGGLQQIRDNRTQYKIKHTGLFDTPACRCDMLGLLIL